jgi:hypothetical protein
VGRIGIDLISDEMRQWLDTNPTRSRPDADVPRAVAEPAPGEPDPAEPPAAGNGSAKDQSQDRPYAGEPAP